MPLKFSTLWLAVAVAVVKLGPLQMLAEAVVELVDSVLLRVFQLLPVRLTPLLLALVDLARLLPQMVAMALTLFLLVVLQLRQLAVAVVVVTI